MSLMAQLPDRVKSLRTPGLGRPVLVGIDGAGATGKSTIAGELARSCGSGAVVVHGDDFYTGTQRTDREWATLFDVDRLEAEVLRPARAGAERISYRRYDWSNSVIGDAVEVIVGDVLIVEGVYVTHPGVHGLYDLTAWVECSYEERLRRGVERDGESMRSTWTDLWMPEEDLYRQMFRPDLHADITLITD